MGTTYNCMCVLVVLLINDIYTSSLTRIRSYACRPHGGLRIYNDLMPHNKEEEGRI